MEVIPAIDLKGGRCVRLFQGDFSQETVFSDDPLAVARSWQEQGAPRLHLVDLDGAAQGTPANLPVIEAIVAELSIPVQVGGGIRSRDTAAALLSAGVSQVVVGTAAIENPALVADLCREYGGGRVIVAVDARDGMVAIKGWTEDSRITALALARQIGRFGRSPPALYRHFPGRHADRAQLCRQRRVGRKDRAAGASLRRRGIPGTYPATGPNRRGGGNYRHRPLPADY